MGGVLGVKNSKVWKIYQTVGSNWHQIWYTSADSSGNGHRLKTVSPSIPQRAFWGGFRGQKFKSLENLPNGWTDWHQIWYTSADSYGNGHRLKTTSPSGPGGSFWGLGGQNVIKSLRNAMICREKMKLNYIKMKCTNRHNYAATIPGEAG